MEGLIFGILRYVKTIIMVRHLTDFKKECSVKPAEECQYQNH